MTVLHYKNHFENDNYFHLLDDFGESNTDKTFFRPDISRARASLGSLTANASGKVGLYDFPDGKDTGDTLMTFLRNKALDRTEIDSAEKMIRQRLDDLKNEDVQKWLSENDKKNNKEIMDSLKDFLTRDSAVDVLQSTKTQQNVTK